MIELDIIRRGDLKSLPHKTIKRNFRVFNQIFCSSLDDVFRFAHKDSVKVLINPEENTNFTDFIVMTTLAYKLKSGNFVVYNIEAKK